MWNDVNYYDLCANEEFGFRLSPEMQQASETGSATTVSAPAVVRVGSIAFAFALRDLQGYDFFDFGRESESFLGVFFFGVCTGSWNFFNGIVMEVFFKFYVKFDKNLEFSH